MPTGYTADIVKGITFQQYALSCSRAFGACISLRDEPSSTPIPERFDPSDYHEKALVELRDRLEELKTITPEQAEIEADNDYNGKEVSRVIRLHEISELRKKYETMLANARSWTPPTPEHKELKNFMCSQIEQSIDFDCSDIYYRKLTERKTGSQWLNEEMTECARKIGYHEEKHAEEVASAKRRTDWVRALRESLASGSNNAELTRLAEGQSGAAKDERRVMRLPTTAAGENRNEDADH